MNKFMKELLMLFVFTLSAEAQTNFFPLLKTASGSYTNATVRSVTATDIIIFFDGGGAKVALSNLSPELQKRFGYDPANDAKAAATRKQKIESAQQRLVNQQATDSWRGEQMKAQILAIDGQIGGMTKCTLVTTNGTFNALLTSVPSSISQHLSKKQQLKTEIERRSAINRNEAQRLRNLKHQLPSEAPTGTASGNAIRQFNIDTDNLEDSATTVNDMVSSLADLEAISKEMTSCSVRQTPKKYGGFQIWEVTK